MLKGRRVAAIVVGVALLLGGLAPAARAAPLRCAWPMYGHDIGHSFAQTVDCTTINAGRALTLLPSWFVPTADSVTASPAIVGDTVYVGGWDGIFHALDARTGKKRWTFEIGDTNNVGFGRIVASAAVVDVGSKRVVLFAGGATLYALDAANGHELASICLDPRSNPALRCQGGSEADIEIESSPAVFSVGKETRIVIGMDVHNARAVGRTGIVSLRLRPGPSWRLEPLWKFDPEAETAYTGTNLLTVGSGTGSGCAGVWSSPAVDVANDRVFFGTSSCSVDNVTAGESLWGVRLSTGALVWKFQPHEPPFPSRRWDDDFGASPNLLPFGLVGNGGKDGWYYALDRITGQLRWATHAGQAGHLTSGFAVGGMIGSAAVGLTKGEPTIFATTAISTPLRAPLDETPLDLDPTLVDDPQRMLSLHAIRVRDGKLLWRSLLPRASYGAATYANGVVLVPSTFDFSVNAIDAENGLPLWAAPVIGAPSSAAVILGPSVVIGAGTRTTDIEYKAFGADALTTLSGASILSPLSGVWGFRLALN